MIEGRIPCFFTNSGERTIGLEVGGGDGNDKKIGSGCILKADL